jgi:hypothetical protein
MVKGNKINLNSNDKMNPIQQIEIFPSESGEPISGSITPFMPVAQGGLN